MLNVNVASVITTET